MAKARKEPPVTASEIREILGPVENGTVAAILAIGATRNEVMEAYAWLSADDQLRRERHHTISGKAAEVWRVLEAELPPTPDER